MLKKTGIALTVLMLVGVSATVFYNTLPDNVISGLTLGLPLEGQFLISALLMFGMTLVMVFSRKPGWSSCC